jgi:dephospho-CoA kinase
MLRSRKIAVTGDLGAGKTIVCQAMQDLGAYVVNADEICHQLLESNQSCIQQVETVFGQDVKVKGQIDRKKIAELAFSSRHLLKALEDILHPLVLKQLESLYKETNQLKQKQFFVVEVPLLFEVGWGFFFDTVIAVTADPLICQKRCLKKGLSLEQYFLRKQRQLASEEKTKRADFIIINNGTFQELKNEVQKIIKIIEPNHS